MCGFRVTSGEGPVTTARLTVDPPPDVPILIGDPPLVVDAISRRGSLEDVLRGDDAAMVDRLGVLARFFTTPA